MLEVRLTRYSGEVRGLDIDRSAGDVAGAGQAIGVVLEDGLIVRSVAIVAGSIVESGDHGTPAAEIPGRIILVPEGVVRRELDSVEGHMAGTSSIVADC